MFISPVWERLGFKQTSDGLQPRNLLRLGVKNDPSIGTIIEYFKNPRQTLPDEETAAIWFEYLYLHGSMSVSSFVFGCRSDSKREELPYQELREQLSTISFVPVKTPGPSSSEPPTIEYLSPKECFVMSSDSKEHYRKNFPYVDFRQEGNSFLEACCAKKSPDTSDIVRKIVQDPHRYLTALENDTDL